MNLNAQVQKAFSRLEDLSQFDSPSRELTSKLISELNSALHELQTTAVELLEQNEEMATSRRALEKERCRYQELFDFAPECYLVTDTEGVIIDANSAATNLFKVSRSMLIGKPLAIFVRNEEHLTFRTRLAEMKELLPDIVTMDITMPEMSGIEAMKKIKALDPKAKVIMVTAMGQENMVKDAIVSGAKNYLVKPFTEERLLQVLDKLG